MYLSIGQPCHKTASKERNISHALLSFFLSFLVPSIYCKERMAPREESELKAVSKKKQFKLLERRVEVKKNGIKDLKRLKAVLEALVKQQAKLLAKLNLAELYSPREVKPTKDKLGEVNRRLAKFNARTKIYLETKLSDPDWDAANIGK